MAGLFIALLLFGAAPAAAQGPCPHCIEPATARVHSKLRVGYPTVQAVWNPPRRVLTKGPKPNCYGCNLRLWRFHVEGSPSYVVHDGPRVPGFVFRAPHVKPGRYLVALFDGSEGGTHYTWDFVRLEAGLPEPEAEDALPDWVLPVAIGGGLLLAAMAALALLRKRA
jgi:hypothetical protein